MLDIDQSGFILYTINYEACVKFYRDQLGLKIMYEQKDLCCFEFGGAYLMVEVDDESENRSISAPRDKTCLRLNVHDISKALELLDSKGIEYYYFERAWGKVAKFRDPDQNLIAFRSAREHIEARS